ncbi:MAG: tetratricopeptide repeat protein [Myxococcota bacterium]
MHALWSRVREGRHAVVEGSLPALPTTEEGEPTWVIVRVGREGPWSTWGAIEGARRRIEELFGEQSLPWDQAVDRMGSSNRLLGDLPRPSTEATLVGAANRLADQHPQRSALVLEQVDEADEATVQALHEILGREGWLRLPLVLCIGAAPEQGALAELLARIDGDAIVGEAASADDDDGYEWSGLPAEQLMVMRAAAVIGRSFETELVSRLLGVSEDAVLMRLQQAVDLGAPVTDQGGGQFVMADGSQRALVRRILPSLVERWHRRLGALLAEPPDLSFDIDIDEPRADEPGFIDDEVVVEVDEETEAATPGESTEDDEADYTELLEAPEQAPLRAPSHDGDEGEGGDDGEEETSSTMRLEPEDAQRLLGAARAAYQARDQARAAHHLEEAGLPERAVEQYLAALRTVAARGDSRRALVIAEQALTLLERQPASRARDLLHARVLAMMARVQWRGAGGGSSLTLQGALESLDVAIELLGHEAPLELGTEIAQLVAGVCYDLGDISSLQRALDALTDAARDLMNAGESTRAARLLNDQAAVYLRAGDPVRANHLLQQSRSIFDDMHRSKPDDPTVIIERAETEHLLARLPLHARLRSGREDDAYSLALGHARSAAEGYKRLGGRVELGRVYESMGRLETARGRYEQAAKHIDAALEISRQLEDVTGLARGTAALADLYIADERPAEALGALSESVAFNVEKGSPLGLAVNRRTMDRLGSAIAGASTEQELTKAVEELDASLRNAESMLGRVSVPDEST